MNDDEFTSARMVTAWPLVGCVLAALEEGRLPAGGPSEASGVRPLPPNTNEKEPRNA